MASFFTGFLLFSLKAYENTAESNLKTKVAYKLFEIVDRHVFKLNLLGTIDISGIRRWTCEVGGHWESGFGPE